MKGETKVYGKKRVIALGGCGGTGQFAVRTDLDEARAREFAAQRGAKAGYARIDIEDSPAYDSSKDLVVITIS